MIKSSDQTHPSSPILYFISSNKIARQSSLNNQYLKQNKKSTSKFYQPIEDPQSYNLVQTQDTIPQQESIPQNESQKTLSQVFLKDLKQQLRLNKRKNEILLNHLIPSQTQESFFSQSQQAIIPMSPQYSLNKNNSLFLIDSKNDKKIEQFASQKSLNIQSQSENKNNSSLSEKKFLIKNSATCMSKYSTNKIKFPSCHQGSKNLFQKQTTLDFQHNNSNSPFISHLLPSKVESSQKQLPDLSNSISQFDVTNTMHQSNSQKILKRNLNFINTDEDFNQFQVKQGYLNSVTQYSNKNISDELQNKIQKNKLDKYSLDCLNMSESLNNYGVCQTDQLTNRKRNISSLSKFNQTESSKQSIFTRQQQLSPKSNLNFFQSNPNYDDNKFKFNLPISEKNVFKQKNNQLLKQIPVLSINNNQAQSPNNNFHKSSFHNSAKSPTVQHFKSPITSPLKSPTNIQKFQFLTNEQTPKQKQLSQNKLQNNQDSSLCQKDPNTQQSFSLNKQLGKNFVTEYLNFSLKNTLNSQQSQNSKEDQNTSPIANHMNLQLDLQDVENQNQSYEEEIQVQFTGSPTNKDVQNVLKNLQKNNQEETEQKRSQFHPQKKEQTQISYDKISQSIQKKQNLPFGDEIDKKKLSLQANLKKSNTVQTIQSELIHNQLAKLANIAEDEGNGPSTSIKPQQQEKQINNIASTKDIQPSEDVISTQKKDKKSQKNKMNQENKIFRQIVSQNQRKKLVPAQVRTAFKKAIYYLRSLNIPVCDLLTTTVFSSKPFQKQYSYDLIQAAKFGEIMKVKECLNENKYLVYDFDYIYQTALHWAIKRNHLQIADILLKSGADVNCKDIIFHLCFKQKMGRTPLYFAIQLGFTDLVLLLLEKKASPWSSEEINYVELAKDNQKITQCLNKFKKINIIVSMVAFSKQQQLWDKQIQLLHY